eukprot:4028447-Prymnesium_polylepis.1
MNRTPQPASLHSHGPTPSPHLVSRSAQYLSMTSLATSAPPPANARASAVNAGQNSCDRPRESESHVSAAA